MSNPITTLRRAGGACAALAAIAAVAPAGATAAVAPDPSIKESGIPFNVVEHAVIDFSLSGNGSPEHRTIEYWASGDRWRETVKNAVNNQEISEAYSDGNSTHQLNINTPNNDPRVAVSPYGSVPDMAGYGAPYNKFLLGQGLLQAVGPVTIAGLQATKYVVPHDKQVDNPDADNSWWKTDEPNSTTTLVLEDGTLAPLLRETTLPNGKYGTFDQREAVTSRTRTARTASTFAPLSDGALLRTKSAWAAKVRQAKHKHRG